ncbi:MAG TPA: DMT family transporter [Anaerolineales bacterium]
MPTQDTRHELENEQGFSNGSEPVTGRDRVLWMLLITSIYAACFTAIKAGLVYAPPLLFAGLRAMIGGIALLGWALFRHEPLLPSRVSWKGLLALAFTATTLTFGAMFLSPGRTGAGIASVLGSLQALVTVALAAVFLGEPLTSGKGVALALGLAGVTLIAYPALAGPQAYGISGPVLALAVSFNSALSNVIVKRMQIQRSLLAVTAWQLILGSLPLLAVSAWLERGSGQTVFGAVTWNLPFISLLLFLALAGTSFVTAAWYWLIQREDVGRLSIFFYLVPVFGLGISALAFRESLGLYEGLGVVLILAGVGAAAGWGIWQGDEKKDHRYPPIGRRRTRVDVDSHH